MSDVYIPENKMNDDRLNTDSIMAKLRVAESMAPVRMSDIRHSNNPCLLESIDGDNIIVKSLYHNANQFAACLAYMDKDSVIKPHYHGSNHDCLEIMHCQSGSVILTLENDPDDHILKQGDTYMIPAGISHHVRATNTAILLCITIPPDPDFPGASC